MGNFFSKIELINKNEIIFEVFYFQKGGEKKKKTIRLLFGSWVDLVKSSLR